MKEPKNDKIIYFNWMQDNFTDNELREAVAESYEIPIDEVTNEQMESYWRDEDYTNWENESYELEKFFKKNSILLAGTAQRWTGTARALKIFETFKDFQETISHYDNVRIFSKDGKTFINLYHHDGTHHFEIKILNEEHCQLSIDKNNMYEFEELGMKLETPYYSKKVDLHKLFYGA